MKRNPYSTYAFTVISIFLLRVAHAEDRSNVNICINAESGTLRNLAVVEEVQRAISSRGDALTRAFLERQALQGTICVECSTPQRFAVAKKLSKDIQEIVAGPLAPGLIKKECIEASMKREPGGIGNTCNKGSAKTFDNGRSRACIDQQTLDLTHFAVNEALSCFKDIGHPVDGSVIVRKFNNETAFYFSLSSGDGKGIGQLTSFAVKEVTRYRYKEKVVQGRGNEVLQSLMKSNSKACAPFKEILGNDVNEITHIISNRTCAWTSPSKGLAKSLAYSMAYYSFLKEIDVPGVIEKFRKKYGYKTEGQPSWLDDKEVQNLLLLTAYGPGGTVAAKALLDAMGGMKNDNRTADDIISAMYEYKGKFVGGGSVSGYISNTRRKTSEMLYKRGIDSSTASEDDKRGLSCIY